MGNEALRHAPDTTRATLPLEEVPLDLGKALGNLVAAVGLAETDLTVEADSEASKLVINGTHEQIDVFTRAVGFYRESVEHGFTGKALSSLMNCFLTEQMIRYRKA
jgi:hypothetical protein